MGNFVKNLKEGEGTMKSFELGTFMLQLPFLSIISMPPIEAGVAFADLSGETQEHEFVR